MMLMTYDQYAHIPDKIHIFYEQAFETLFFKHDAAKGAGFRRKMYTDLAINDFKDCLSALCISSYYKQKFQFSEAEILAYINKAAQSEKIELKERDFMRDLLESVCILQRDGLFVSFIHRSFQEYFGACFIVTRSPLTTIGELFDIFSPRPEVNVIAMAFDMNKGLVEREWILPRIGDLAYKLRNLDPVKNFHQLCKLTYERFSFAIVERGLQPGHLIHVQPLRCPLLRVLRRLYPVHFAAIDESLVFSIEESVAVKEKIERGGMRVQRGGMRVLRLVGNITIVQCEASGCEWLTKTSFEKVVRDEYNSLISLKEVVETSVDEQKTLAGALFQ
jgi:hypothetical protein